MTTVGDFSRAALVPYLDPDVEIDNGYSVYTIEFFTDGAVARATVTIPFETPPPASGWHVVENAHGTTGIGDPCAVTGTVLGSGLAGLFGARGFVGVAPDYPGLGTPGLHPYLVKRSEAHAMLDGLRATRALAAWVGVPLSGRSAVVGLSQGGYATLAAASAHHDYAPELDIRAFAVAGPASVWEEHWRSGITVDGEHLVYHALIMHSFAHYYGVSVSGVFADAIAPSIDSVMETNCAYSPAGAPLLSDVLPMQAAALFSPEFLSEYQTGAWNVYAEVHDAFEENRIVPYVQTAPLKVYQGDADVVVLEGATRDLVASLRAGGVEVSYEVVEGAGHVDVAFGYLAAAQRRTQQSLAWIRSQLERR